MVPCKLEDMNQSMAAHLSSGDPGEADDSIRTR